ncbi:MAG: hypothetical protein KZQ77_07610, partial [Candidatus Thiodiazotropha sp. (ex Notomyrtea botanica)]|nr:hypothetical protein [Candidatus Thiodiazotropha sp. (ex Notomyrtea botanica)]
TILTAEKADDIEEAVWSRHFQGALEMAETLIQRDYEDPSWIEKKTWLLSLRGKRYARVKNYPKAIRTFEPLAIFGLEQTRRYPDTRNISTNTLYGIRELIKVLHASDNWDGIAKASELLLQHVDPASEREIRYPKDELRYWKSVHKALESARKTSGELYTGVSNKEVSTDVNPQPTKTILDRLDGVLEASNDRMAYLEELIVSQPAGTPNISEDDNHKLDPKSLNISGLVEKDSEGGLYTAGRPLGWRIPSIYPGPTSYNLMGESFEKISELLVKAFPLDPGKKILRIRSTHLPFYDDGQLLTVESGIRRRSDTTKHYLRSGIQVYVLNGTSSPIHKANKKFPLRLQSKADATAYLRFFTTFVHHDDGSFLPVESSKEIPWADGVPQETKLRVANLVRPINVWTEPDQPDTWYAIATINYSDELFHAKFKFDKSGKMKMLEDMSVAKGLPVNYLKFVDKGRTSDIDRLYLHLINGIDISSTKKEIETLGGLAKELDESQADHRGSITTEMLALAHATVPNDITVDNLRSAMENYFTVLDIMGDVSLQMAPAANTQFHSLIKKGREAIEKAYGEGENSNLRKLAGACTSLSYFQLKIRDFDGALSTARRGIEFNSDSLPIYTNYAHALLFLGREEEAMAVYREHKSKPIGKETWDFYVLDDFDQFEKLGITHPGIARVRKMMKQG